MAPPWSFRYPPEYIQRTSANKTSSLSQRESLAVKLLYKKTHISIFCDLFLVLTIWNSLSFDSLTIILLLDEILLCFVCKEWHFRNDFKMPWNVLQSHL